MKNKIVTAKKMQRMMRMTGVGICILLFLTLQAQAAITVYDDDGNAVTLGKPAQRVITLAPHATELVFAAGGGDRVVGTISHSDYPPAALEIPRVGSHQQIDIERIIALKPDLLIVWLHGNSERQLGSLRQLGIPFFYTEPKKLTDIPVSIARLGKLMGTEAQADKTAAAERAELTRLAKEYSNKSPVRTFYQVWGKPIYTLNGKHILSDVMRLCGGKNVFADLSVTAPNVSEESVILANPEAMITGARSSGKTSGLEIWQRHSDMLAVKNHNLFSIDADLLNRAGPRLIEGATLVCQALQQARTHRQPQKTQ
tara:strand:- start:402584 stop:403522 length:939 start_codon:yes stop_codon:yes gene_type:complete